MFVAFLSTVELSCSQPGKARTARAKVKARITTSEAAFTIT
jgi:hypothetical protein